MLADNKETNVYSVKSSSIKSILPIDLKISHHASVIKNLEFVIL